MTFLNRRNFIKASGWIAAPIVLPMSLRTERNIPSVPSSPVVKFFGDGEMFDAPEYLATLSTIQNAAPIVRDRYGAGGAVEALEKKFREITGKEASVFMPTGTMANQLAISVLSGDNTKVFVQETSHVFRDEGDAAQSVFEKRLIPLAKDETYFTVDQLKAAIDGLADSEVFQSGVGAVSIENPVRRTDGKMFPIEEIRKISTYCRANKIPLHLDGARIFLASAWSGISILEYASYFDTIYISLYKYLGASAGAMLCGDKEIIGKMPHLMKVHGGSMYGNWLNAAMALSRVEHAEQRFKETVVRAGALVTALSLIPGITITAMPGGTNLYTMTLDKAMDGTKLQSRLNQEFNIRIPRPNEQHKATLGMNETLLYQSVEFIAAAFRKCMTA